MFGIRRETCCLRLLRGVLKNTWKNQMEFATIVTKTNSNHNLVVSVRITAVVIVSRLAFIAPDYSVHIVPSSYMLKISPNPFVYHAFTNSFDLYTILSSFGYIYIFFFAYAIFKISVNVFMYCDLLFWPNF